MKLLQSKEASSFEHSNHCCLPGEEKKGTETIGGNVIPEEYHLKDLTDLLDGVTLARLQEVFNQVMRRADDKIDPLRSRFGKIRREPMKVSDKISQVVRLSRREKKFSFRSLLEKQKDRFEIVVTFLAVLELMKVGWLSLSQEELFGDIEIEANLPSDEAELEKLELEFA